MKQIDRNAVVEFRYRELYKKRVLMDVHLCQTDDPALWNWAMDVMFRTARINTWQSSYIRQGSTNFLRWALVILLANGEKITYIGINDYPQNWDPFWVLMDGLSRRLPSA